MATLRDLIAERDRMWKERSDDVEAYNLVYAAIYSHPIVLAASKCSSASYIEAEALDALMQAIVPEAVAQCKQILDENQGLRAENDRLAGMVVNLEENGEVYGERVVAELAGLRRDLAAREAEVEQLRGALVAFMVPAGVTPDELYRRARIALGSGEGA